MKGIESCYKGVDDLMLYNTTGSQTEMFRLYSRQGLRQLKVLVLVKPDKQKIVDDRSF